MTAARCAVTVPASLDGIRHNKCLCKLGWILEAALSIFLGIGLSAACGFRVFVPFFVMSLAAQNGYLELTAGFAWIDSPAACTAFGVATICEVLAYYIPLVDNFLDMVATPAAMVAGTLAAAAVMTGLSPFWTWSLAVIAGAGITGTTQASTTAVRSTSTLVTAGFGNPLIATGELAGAIITSLLAIVLPVVAAICVGIFLIVVIGRLRKLRSRHASGT